MESSIEAMEKRLWTAADQLRANSDFASNEYFLPVMGLISCATPIAAIRRSNRISRLDCPVAAA